MPTEDNVERRSFLKAAGGAAAAATLAGCTGNPNEGSPTDGGGDDGGDDGGGDDGGDDGGMEPSGTLVWARGSHSATLDPQQTTSGEDVKVTNQIFDQLIRFVPGGGGELSEGLATEYSLNGTTTELTLREGVTFHNGEEFTADDFIATYRRFVDTDYEYYIGKENVSAYGSITLGSWVESMEASGDYSLTIELKQKYAPFLRNLAMFATSVLSEAQIESLGDNQAQLGQEPVGTGAFSLTNYDNQNERIKLDANTEYHGDGPMLASVIFNTIGQNSTRASALVNGEADIIDGIGAQASQQIQDAGSAELRSKDGINIGYMAMNQSRREEFRDKRVRQAISYAVNTKAIVEQIYEGFASQADQPIPPNVLGYNDDVEPYPQDQQQAQSLLEEAGYGDGFEVELATFKNPRGYNPSPIETAQQVKSDLAEVGIEVTIRQMAFSPFLDYTLTGKHDMCFLGWYTDNADPDNFYFALLHPETESPDGQDWVSWENQNNVFNVSAWANAEFMSLVEQGQATYDPNERAEIYAEAGALANEEAPWVYIDYAKTLRGVNNRVSNYTVSSIGGPYLNTVTVGN